jgi:hypothetical protein
VHLPGGPTIDDNAPDRFNLLEKSPRKVFSRQLQGNYMPQAKAVKDSPPGIAEQTYLRYIGEALSMYLAR